MEVSEKQKAALGVLQLRLETDLGQKFDDQMFNDLVALYLRNSRRFHGLDHLLMMTGTQGLGPNRYAATVSRIAGFFHDCEYPSIGEKMGDANLKYISKYVNLDTEPRTIKPIDKDDKIGQMLIGLFGFKEGEKLNAFGGMNEFYSAIIAASMLKEVFGKDDRFIAGIIAGIEATRPFLDKDRLNVLQDRLIKVNEDLKLGIGGGELRQVMIGATYLANMDVISLMGGLDPFDPKSKPTRESVLLTLKDGDAIRPEEVPELRVYGEDAQKFPLTKFVEARAKAAGLYLVAIPSDDTNRTIPNLFHQVKLKDGSVYPGQDWAKKANEAAYRNNQPVMMAECARLVAASIMYALAAKSGDERLNPDTAILREMVAGLPQRLPAACLPVGASDITKLAYICLSERHEAGYGPSRSPIAQTVLAELAAKDGFNMDMIRDLAKALRDNIVPAKNAAQLFEILSEKVPDSLMVAQEQMAISISKNVDKQAGQSMRGVEIPNCRTAG